MTRHDDRHGVGTKRMADGPRIPTPSDLRCDPLIGPHTTVRNVLRRPPDPLLKWRPTRQIEGKIESVSLSTNELTELRSRFPQHA